MPTDSNSTSAEHMTTQPLSGSSSQFNVASDFIAFSRNGFVGGGSPNDPQAFNANSSGDELSTTPTYKTDRLHTPLTQDETNQQICTLLMAWTVRLATGGDSSSLRLNSASRSNNCTPVSLMAVRRVLKPRWFSRQPYLSDH